MKHTILKRRLPYEIDYFPLVLDYDFEKNRPRGGSACVDFFHFGKLSTILEETGTNNLIFISRSDIMPSSGFFLMDFARAVAEPDYFTKSFSGLRPDKLFVEKSDKFPLDKFVDKLDDISVVFIEF